MRIDVPIRIILGLMDGLAFNNRIQLFPAPVYQRAISMKVSPGHLTVCEKYTASTDGGTRSDGALSTTGWGLTTRCMGRTGGNELQPNKSKTDMDRTTFHNIIAMPANGLFDRVFSACPDNPEAWDYSD